jgi:hypothetical protein
MTEHKAIPAPGFVDQGTTSAHIRLLLRYNGKGSPQRLMKPLGLALDTAPMEARSAEALPTEPGKWQFEPKWDGFRCLVFKEAARSRFVANLANLWDDFSRRSSLSWARCRLSGSWPTANC